MTGCKHENKVLWEGTSNTHVELRCGYTGCNELLAAGKTGIITYIKSLEDRLANCETERGTSNDKICSTCGNLEGNYLAKDMDCPSCATAGCPDCGSLSGGDSTGISSCGTCGATQ